MDTGTAEKETHDERSIFVIEANRILRSRPRAGCDAAGSGAASGGTLRLEAAREVDELEPTCAARCRPARLDARRDRARRTRRRQRAAAARGVEGPPAIAGAVRSERRRSARG